MCSVLGSILLISGLYLLLWGKRQEALHCPPKDNTEDDKERAAETTGAELQLVEKNTAS
jgi:hypothetical protein